MWAYQHEQFQDLMATVSGDRNMTVDSLRAQLNAMNFADDDVMLSVFRTMRVDLQNQVDANESMQDELDSANARLDQEIRAKETLAEDHQQTIDALQNEIDRIQARADDYAQRVQAAEQRMDDRVLDIRNQLAAQKGEHQVDKW